MTEFTTEFTTEFKNDFDRFCYAIIYGYTYMVQQNIGKDMCQDDIVTYFKETLGYGNIDTATWLMTLTNEITIDDYKDVLFTNINDKTVDWIFNQVRFTPLFKLIYNILRAQIKPDDDEEDLYILYDKLNKIKDGVVL